jgi:hypothetical protein
MEVVVVMSSSGMQARLGGGRPRCTWEVELNSQRTIVVTSSRKR